MFNIPTLLLQAGVLPPVPGKIDVIGKRASVWQTKEKIQLDYRRLEEALKQGFDHTEFELLKTIFGDAETNYLMFNATKESYVQKYLLKYKAQMEEASQTYVKTQLKQEYPVINYEFDSRDFEEDGTYRYYSAFKQAFQAWLKKQGIDRDREERRQRNQNKDPEGISRTRRGTQRSKLSRQSHHSFRPSDLLDTFLNLPSSRAGFHQTQ